MNSQRFDPALVEQTPPAPSAAFLVIPVAQLPECGSPLQWLYQRMYEEAHRATQPPKARELFAVMN